MAADDYSGNTTLSEVGSVLLWYNPVNPARTVEIANHLKARASMGEQFF